MLETMTTIRRVNILAGINAFSPPRVVKISSPPSEVVSNKFKRPLKPVVKLLNNGGSFRSNDTYPLQSQNTIGNRTVTTMVTADELADTSATGNFRFAQSFGKQTSARQVMM